MRKREKEGRKEGRKGGRKEEGKEEKIKEGRKEREEETRGRRQTCSISEESHLKVGAIYRGDQPGSRPREEEDLQSCMESKVCNNPRWARARHPGSHRALNK